jgi:hypothetical protein
MMTAELVALVCEVCGEPNRRIRVRDRHGGTHLRNTLHRHHYNGYDGEHREQVRWLCSRHHAAQHPSSHDRSAATLRGWETGRAIQAIDAMVASLGTHTTGEDGR